MILRNIIAVATMLMSAATFAQTPARAPQVIKLWPNGAPGSQAHRGEPERAQDWWVKNVHDPSITPFPADSSHNSGAAIVVLPGGAHREIVWTSEGLSAAKAFNRMGISVFVVKYRLSGEPGSTYSVERDETADVRRAMQWVRAHAGDYKIDPHRIGVMGFSAGGELVGMLADYGMMGTPAGGDA